MTIYSSPLPSAPAGSVRTLTAEGSQHPVDDKLASQLDKPAGLAIARNDQVTIETEISDPVKAVLDRLPSSEATNSLAKHLMENEALLTLAQDLSDKELGQLANVVDAMKVRPQSITHIVNTEIDRLTAALSKLDGETLSRVLEKADGYADNVNAVRGMQRPSSPYSAEGPVYSRQADMLYSLVNAVDVSEDPAALLDKLEDFEAPQQETLLVMVAEHIAGEAVMDELRDKNSDTRNAVMNMLGNLVQEYRFGPTEEPPEVNTVSFANKHGNGFVLTEPEYDNYGKGTLRGMASSVADLMSSYDFSDEQLQDMMGELGSLNRSDQRAYLRITEVGLDTMFGSDRTDTVNLAEHEAELALVDELRSNDSARELVFMSRMGEERTFEGDRLYQLKANEESSTEDAVRLLTLDALATYQLGEEGESTHTTKLSSNLLRLDATDRDNMVAQMNRAVNTSGPLSGLPTEVIEEQFTDLHTRTNALATSNDPEDLMVAQEESFGVTSEKFWQIAELAGSKVDAMADVIMDTPELGSQMLEQLEILATRVEEQPELRNKAEEQISALIQQWSKQSEAQPEKEPSRPERNPWPVDAETLATEYMVYRDGHLAVSGPAGSGRYDAADGQQAG